MRRSVLDGEPDSVYQRRREILWLIVILAVAATLRFASLGQKSLWLDEIMTVQKASGSFADMMRQIRGHDAHPPFFQMVEWLWLRLWRGDAFARVPAVLAGVAGVWLSFKISRRLFGRRAAIAAGIMMALSCFHVFYSQEARLQTLATALVLAQAYLLIRLVDCRGRAGWGLWAAYAALGLLSLYTYSLCVLTVGSLALLYLWLARRRVQWGQWLAAHALMALLFAPWAPVLSARTAMIESSVKQHHDEVGRPSLAEIAIGAAAWGKGPFDWKPVERIATWCGVGLVLAAAAATMQRRAKRPAIVLGFLFFVPLIGYMVLPMPRVHTYDPKHLIFLQPLLLIALSGARVAVKWSKQDWNFSIAAVVVIVVGLINLLALKEYYRPEFQKENWRQLAADVSRQLGPRDLILFNPDYDGFAFDYYATNVQNDKNGASGLLKPGASVAPAYDRIWLIECESAVERPLPQVRERLAALGWRLSRAKYYQGVVGRAHWTLYERLTPVGGRTID